MTVHEYQLDTAGDPTAGQIRSDAVGDAATSLAVHDVTAAGLDIHDQLAAIPTTSLLTLQDWGDHDRYTRYEVAGVPVDSGAGFLRVPVTWQSAGASFASGRVALILPTPAVPAPGPTPSGDRRPIADLAAYDSYAPVSDLDTALGGGGYAVAQPQPRLRELCLIVATRWVAYRVGAVVTDLELDPTDVVAVAGFQVVPAKPSWRQATVVAAVRFYKSPEVPFGVAGGWDMATYVRAAIPDAELLLYGQRSGWGIA